MVSAITHPREVERKEEAKSPPTSKISNLEGDESVIERDLFHVKRIFWERYYY